MLRKCVKYPLENIIDSTIVVDGEDCKVIHTDTSLAFRLDVEEVDLQTRAFVREMLSPSKVQYLDTETLSKDNVFEMLNPLTSRFITDASMRNQVISTLIEESKKRSEELSAAKESAELKKKYDDFIKSLS